LSTTLAHAVPENDPHMLALLLAVRRAIAAILGVPLIQTTGMVEMNALSLRSMRCRDANVCHATGSELDSRFLLRSTTVSPVSTLQARGKLPDNLQQHAGEAHVSKHHNNKESQQQAHGSNPARPNA
jgi:hypothetical protein